MGGGGGGGVGGQDGNVISRGIEPDLTGRYLTTERGFYF